jgi:EAL domain-containing protein (putative c-di-GMP-specific phosphodiesterase class I)
MSRRTDHSISSGPAAMSTPFSELLGLDVSMHFAPIRRLDNGALAGAELQLAGPKNSALSSATALRRAAQLMAQRSEFDHHKQVMARTESARAVADRLPLLVTLDSQSRSLIDTPEYVDGAGALERMVVTIDAQSVLSDPHHALAAAAAARAGGRLIALDAVGVDVHAATLLSLVEPDIVVTAAEFLSGEGQFDVGAGVHAVSAYLERSSAVIVAEGIDNEAARLSAITIGATYGLGQLFPPVDDPADLLSEEIVAMPDTPVWTAPTPEGGTPYAIASGHGTPRRGTKRLLIQMSKALESQAAAAGASMIALGTFQRAEHFTATTAMRWRHLADTIGFAGIYSVGLSSTLDGNIRHAPLDAADALVDEWNVVTLGPHHAALLSARDRHDNGPDLERTFDFVQTYDRSTVVHAARAIMHRYTP